MSGVRNKFLHHAIKIKGEAPAENLGMFRKN